MAEVVIVVQEGVTLGDQVLSEDNIVLGKPVTVSTVLTLGPPAVGQITDGITKSSMWTGEGPPHLVIGAEVGDEYLDTLTGTVYRLDPGV